MFECFLEGEVLHVIEGETKSWNRVMEYAKRLPASELEDFWSRDEKYEFFWKSRDVQYEREKEKAVKEYGPR